MKFFIPLLLILSCGAQVVPDYERVCTHNMQTIMDAENYFFSIHNRYTPDLSELGLDLCCPLSGQKYYIAVNADETEVAIMCPSGHGSFKSWFDFRR